MTNWWKRITGVAKLEEENGWLAQQLQSAIGKATRESARADLAVEEYKKMEKVIRENSDRVSEWATEKMRMNHTIETLERKVEELKKQIRSERNDG